MESPLEFHSLKPDNEIASLLQLRLRWIYGPGDGSNRYRGCSVHVILY